MVMKQLNRNILFILLFSSIIYAQDNLESLLGPLSSNSIITNTFKSTRVINAHSIEIFEPHQLDLRISHRFGLLNSGAYELYGLDQATIRIGLEYGLMKNMMLGIGRSSYNKTYDGFIKYILLKQQRGDVNVPLSIAYFSNIALTSLKQNYEDYPFTGRLSFCNQFILASKINSILSVQLMPTIVHWNMVDESSESNNIYLMGLAARYMISRSVSINSEYFIRYLNNSNLSTDNYFNSFSLGVDIETGGHVFQLHITNSLPMYESGFMTRTQSAWPEGGIHFGFNISREFNL